MAERSIDLKLIVGLGNPGPEYTETRHNAGFWFVEELAAANSAPFRAEKKFHGDVAKINLAGRDIWMLKPQTFMNRSGQAIKSLSSFYRIEPENILVAHDELDLEAGDIKLKTGGGHGGHNGLRDTIAHLGTKDFHRLRIGIGHPGNRNQVVDYVLHRPSQDERIAIDACISNAQAVMPLLAEGAMEKAMHKLHTK